MNTVREIPSVRWQCQVHNPQGIHCRVAGRLTEIIAGHDAEVQLVNRDEEIDCTSILEILSLALVQGSQVDFIARGREADKVQAAINRLLSSTTPP